MISREIFKKNEIEAAAQPHFLIGGKHLNGGMEAVCPNNHFKGFPMKNGFFWKR